MFYERRPTEPDLATELVKRLGLGGVFIDVGAHIGMYSLIAARVVETTGQVFAIEPQQACWTALQRNILLNGLDNIAHVPAAVGARDGQARFSSNSRSMGGMIAENGESTVPLMRLDTFARDHSLHYIDVLKLDAAGNEYAALRGADELLAGRRIGAILCKLYRPSVTEDRFNYNASLVVRHLREAHYLVSVLPAGTQPKRDSCDQHDVAELFDWTTYTRTLLAVPSELTGTENRNGH